MKSYHGKGHLPWSNFMVHGVRQPLVLVHETPRQNDLLLMLHHTFLGGSL